MGLVLVRFIVSATMTLCAWALLSVLLYAALAYWLPLPQTAVVAAVVRTGDAQQIANTLLRDDAFLMSIIGVAACLMIWDRLLVVATLTIIEQAEEPSERV